MDPHFATRPAAPSSSARRCGAEGLGGALMGGGGAARGRMGGRWSGRHGVETRIGKVPPPAPVSASGPPPHLRLAGPGRAAAGTTFAHRCSGLELGRRRASALRRRPINRLNMVSKVVPHHTDLIKYLLMGSIVGCFERREGDSNPRDPWRPYGFQGRCIRPLCHPSEGEISGLGVGLTEWFRSSGSRR